MDEVTQKSVKLPSDSTLLENVLRKLTRAMVVLGCRWHDVSLLQHATRVQRRSLTSVLDKLFFCCESCGDKVQIHWTDAQGATHGYCRACYSELVLQLPAVIDEYHPGYNAGANEEVLQHDRTFHGYGACDDDYFD